jgi:hypothetical protein
MLARFAARELAAATSVRSYAIPAPLPPLPISAGWHARYDADPEHRWLRALIKEIASDLVCAGRPLTELPLRVAASLASHHPRLHRASQGRADQMIFVEQNVGTTP